MMAVIGRNFLITHIIRFLKSFQLFSYQRIKELHQMVQLSFSIMSVS